jgi:glycosyltransferase involved in cell wall biosynthesis
MRLNWFSPLPPALTDIAHFTTRVLPELSARADVTLWTDQAHVEPGIAQFAEVWRFELGCVNWEDLNRADACIYNLGNNPLFHGAIWHLARQHAGIVILHDTRLHHFFDGIYRVQERDLPKYLDVMEFYYGAEGRRDADNCFRNEARNINEMAEKYPLTEHALENSIGVVVHTQRAFADLSKQTRPVAYLPLPFASPALGTRASRSHGDTGQGDEYRLVMFGYIARNRRLEAVLQALSEMHDRERFHLDVFGEILDHEKQIKAQIRELGLKKLVTLHGFAPETELDGALSQADLAINLRCPTMGEASGSQLRIWAHALPSIVTNIGWYATLPKDAVAHVHAGENEVADIQFILRAFLEDPERFAAMGQRGRKTLAEQHSPESYARGLVEFVEEVKRHRARAALYSLAERTGEVTSELFRAGMTSEMLDGVAAQIRALGPRDPKTT